MSNKRKVKNSPDYYIENEEVYRKGEKEPFSAFDDSETLLAELNRLSKHVMTKEKAYEILKTWDFENDIKSWDARISLLTNDEMRALAWIREYDERYESENKGKIYP